MGREKLACLCCARHCITDTFLLSHWIHTPGQLVQFKMHSRFTNAFWSNNFMPCWFCPVLVQRSTSTTCYERSWNTWPESCACWPENPLGAYCWADSSIAIFLGRPTKSGRQWTDFQQMSTVLVNPGNSNRVPFFVTSAMPCPAMPSMQHMHSVSKAVHWRTCNAVLTACEEGGDHPLT